MQLEEVQRIICSYLRDNETSMIFRYCFDEVLDDLEIHIYQCKKNNRFYFHCEVYNYTNSCLETETICLEAKETIKTMYKDHELEEMIAFIYELRNKFIYSKILDSFIKKEDQEFLETIARAKFALGHVKEECCVCYDQNIVKTICGHNLCRYCFKKLIKRCITVNCDACSQDLENLSVACPLCREVLAHF